MLVTMRVAARSITDLMETFRQLKEAPSQSAVEFQRSLAERAKGSESQSVASLQKKLLEENGPKDKVDVRA